MGFPDFQSDWEPCMVAFTGGDADIATRVTIMGDMTGMVFLLLRKHRQSPQTLGAQWQQAASLESNIYSFMCKSYTWQPVKTLVTPAYR